MNLLDVLGNPLVLKASSIHSGAAHAAIGDPIRHVQLLINGISIQAYLTGGQLSSTRSILPTHPGISMHADGRPVQIRSLKVHPMESIWPAMNPDAK